MLVLTRRESESLIIGDEITVKILSIDVESGQVRIGIDAPLTVDVHRREVFDRIHGENRGVVITHRQPRRGYVQPEPQH